MSNKHSTTGAANKKTGFGQFRLHNSLIRGVEAMGFEEPRPIQNEAIPAALKGRDVMGLAHTGTGKTAAFALPLLDRLQREPGKGPRVLILAPTRELATQIAEEMRNLSRFTNLKIVTVYGGTSIPRQVKSLRRGPEIVVGCPGRVLDLLQRRSLRLERIETLVLDEADHMFDMGFLPDIRRILSALPPRRQNLLFSATMPKQIRKLADEILHKPHVVELADAAPADTIDHALYPVAHHQKRDLLEHVLKRDDFTSAIVFTRTKHRAKRLARQLNQAGHNAVDLQGNKSQSQRDRAMNGFRSGHFDILVATDIASRGIDVQAVSHVINFDVPNTPEAYTHRIGRTGRAELSGTAFTFVTGQDHGWVRATERMIGEAIPRELIEGFDSGSNDRRASSGNGGGSRRKSSGRGRRNRSDNGGSGGRRTPRKVMKVTKW